MKFVSLTTKTTKNIGDEIQILAARQFLPTRTAGTVDRERLGKYSSDPARLIMNGWYVSSTRHWPPSKTLTPLLTSFHMTDLPDPYTNRPTCDAMLEKEGKSFLLKNGPVGARDLGTYRFLLKNSISSYFSGCLTLTIKNRGLKKNQNICSVDVSPAVNEHLGRISDRTIVTLENSSIPDNMPYDQKLARAQETLNTYEQSAVVITTRLHAALPSLALGTPVILINNKNSDASRYLGLKDLVRNCDEEAFLAGMYSDVIAEPSPNATYHAVITENLRRIVSAFVAGTSPDFHFEAISSQNLQAALEAKEANEQRLHAFIARQAAEKSAAQKRSLSLSAKLRNRLRSVL